jgi:hypothetical protein
MLQVMDATVPPYAYVAEARSQRGCDGDTIVAIDIHRYAALSGAAIDRARATREADDPSLTDESPVTGARADVIRAYLRVRLNSVCADEDLRESERLLRAQPFVATVIVTALSLSEGRTRIRVDVVDEWPYLFAVGASSRSVSSATLGTQDLAGRGLTVAPSWRHREGYREGFGLRLVQYGVRGRPHYAALDVKREPIGESTLAEFAAPYLTHRQRFAWLLSARTSTRYLTLVQPSGVDAAVRVERAETDLTWIARAGSRTRGGVVALMGLSLLRDVARTGSHAVVISDTAISATADSGFADAYPRLEVHRAGLVLGFRAVSFVPVQRFRALRAPEDFARGVRASVVIAPSVGTRDGSADILYSADLYAAAGGSTQLVSMRAGGEARVHAPSGLANGFVSGVLVDWYRLSTMKRTSITSMAGATIARTIVPTQLTFRDLDGGLGSGAHADDAGGRRLTLRHEERVLMPWLRSRADLAWAVFADAGKVWKGDVPYGRTSPVRGSVGLSLLAAPRWGKRLVRVDVVMPVNPGPFDGALVIRVRSSDHTGTSWMESRDIARARSGDGPATLTRW